MIKRLLIILAVLFSTCGLAHAQGASLQQLYINNIGRPLAGIKVLVCNHTTSPAANPCIGTHSTLYNNVELSGSPIANPTVTDALGNLLAYVAQGSYDISISGNGITAKTYTVTTGGGGGGGGGTPCVTTPSSLQYNAAGSFGCVTDFTSDGSHTITGSSTSILNMSTTGAAIKIPGTTFPSGIHMGTPGVVRTTGGLVAVPWFSQTDTTGGGLQAICVNSVGNSCNGLQAFSTDAGSSYHGGLLNGVLGEAIHSNAGIEDAITGVTADVIVNSTGGAVGLAAGFYAGIPQFDPAAPQVPEMDGVYILDQCFSDGTHKQASACYAIHVEPQSNSGKAIVVDSGGGDSDFDTTISQRGSSSGKISLLTQAAAGTYNWNWPTSAGTSGLPLLSSGGGATAMQFAALDISTAAVTGQLPIASVGSAGLSGTSPISIASTGVISCSTCITSAATLPSVICSNVTPVTVNANTTADQLLMACQISANTLNSVGRITDFFGAAVYTTPIASSATVTIKAKLCSVSGCGSGTVVVVDTFTSSANPGSVTNNSINFTVTNTTQTGGASAAFENHGNMVIDLGASPGLADATFSDSNANTVGTIDSTATIFLQFTGSFSVASASNSMTMRQLKVMTEN